MRPSTAIRGVLLALFLGSAAAAQTNPMVANPMVANPMVANPMVANPMVGTWGTARRLNNAGIQYATLIVSPDGRFREHISAGNLGALDLFGFGRYDPASRVYQYVDTDWQPKQFCTSAGCMPMPRPPGIGIRTIAQIYFQNPNMMIYRGPDGTMITWMRAH